MTGSTVDAGAGYELLVNGATRTVTGSWIGESLLDVLRDRLGLPGAKGACEQGECGSCSVVMDGAVVCSCLVLGAAAVGSDIRTVESYGEPGQLSDVQQAFVDCGAVQCGFCTPGLIVSVHELLEHDADPDDPTIREALAGNLCRCTGYGRIVEAVHEVSRRRARA